MDFIILLIIGILSLVIIKKIFGLLKTSIGIIISFLFVLLFSMGNVFASEEIISFEAPNEYLSGNIAINYAYDNINIIPIYSLASIDGPELLPMEEESNNDNFIQLESVDTSNWILYRDDCRLTYYGMGEDENGKGYAGLGTRGPLTPGKTIASNILPYGTTVYIEGLGFRTVEDSGSHHLNDGHIDVCSPTWNRHETRSFASTMPQYADVYIVA